VDGGNDSGDVLATIPLLPRGRLHAGWGAGNHLLFAALPVAAPIEGFGSDSAPEASSDEPTATTNVQWGCPSQNERRIAYDTLPLFKTLQRALKEAGKDRSSAGVAVLDFSRAVSDALANEDPGDEAAAETAREKALWDMLELFFATPRNPQGTAAEGLAQWLMRNQAALGGPHSPLAQQLDGLADFLPAEAAADYWECAARATAIGWVGAAVDVLCSHSALQRYADSSTLRADVQAEIGILEPVVLLLRRMPRYARPEGFDTAGRDFHDFTEFQQYRTNWVEQCREFLQSEAEWSAAEAKAPSTAKGLRAVLGVLAGSQPALVEATRSWPELLVALLLHTQPAARPQLDLRPLLRRSRQLRDRADGGESAEPPPPPLPPLASLPEMLLEAAEGDAQSVVATVAAAGCSPWFLAHAPLLMAASPRGHAALHAALPAHGGDQVEAYLLEYVAALAPHRATSRVAAEYLAWCPTHGAAAFERLLPSLPAASALHLAAEFQLPHLAAGVRRQVAAQHSSHGRMGAALAELAGMGDRDGAAHVLAPLLAEVATALTSSPQPELQPVQALSQLTWVLSSLPSAVAPPAATFLLAYQRLALAWDALRAPSQAADMATSKAEAAAAALGALSSAPRPLWLPLAAAVAPLIDSCPPAFDLADTQALLLRLQEIPEERYSLEAVPEGVPQLPMPGAAAEQQTLVVANAIARNLARAYVSP